MLALGLSQLSAKSPIPLSKAHSQNRREVGHPERSGETARREQPQRSFYVCKTFDPDSSAGCTCADYSGAYYSGAGPDAATQDGCGAHAARSAVAALGLDHFSVSEGAVAQP